MTIGQRKILWIVLALNVALAASFAVAGFIADSSALIANALDNASDSLVVISLLALTRPPRWKRVAAKVSGWLLIALAIGVLVDTDRRFFIDSEPLGVTMIIMAIAAAAVNVLCVCGYFDASKTLMLIFGQHVRSAQTTLLPMQVFSWVGR